MIKSIDYKLTKQPGTLSEEQFYPNPKLLSFFEENKNNSRILAIKASNSSGKSFLLNSIANSFNALNLPKEELSPTLRRSITFLADTNHQKIDFEVDIEDSDDAGTLHDNLMNAASKLVVHTAEIIAKGNLQLKKQVLTGNENPAPKIFKGDCEINWSEPINKVNNFIRGLSPYPVAWSLLFQDGKKIGQLRIYKATVLSTVKNKAHGKVVFENGTIQLILSTGILQIDELQWPGKKKMDVKSFLNGFRAQENLSVLGHLD